MYPVDSIWQTAQSVRNKSPLHWDWYESVILLQFFVFFAVESTNFRFICICSRVIWFGAPIWQHLCTAIHTGNGNGKSSSFSYLRAYIAYRIDDFTYMLLLSSSVHTPQPNRPSTKNAFNRQETEKEAEKNENIEQNIWYNNHNMFYENGLNTWVRTKRWSITILACTSLIDMLRNNDTSQSHVFFLSEWLLTKTKMRHMRTERQTMDEQ